MDITSLYTNIPQHKGIATVCKAYNNFFTDSLPIPTHYLREMLSLILKENSVWENSFTMVELTTFGTVVEGWKDFRKFSLKVNMCRFTYTTYEKTLIELRTTPSQILHPVPD